MLPVMIGLEHVVKPPKFLCRITKPELVSFDQFGNFLPHKAKSLAGDVQSVPLVHPADLAKVINWMYRVEWQHTSGMDFILIIFYADRLLNLHREKKKGILFKYGEHFAVAPLSAVKSALSAHAPEGQNFLNNIRYSLTGTYTLPEKIP